MTSCDHCQEEKPSGLREMDIRGLLPNSLVEWEGRVAAVVFTAGCNWRCPYCHGWRFVTEPGSLEPVEAEEVFALIEREAGWLDGLAITGGEPTLQPGLRDFIEAVKRRGAAVKLETNGTRPEVIESLLGANLLDCLSLDYKAPPDGRLAALAGIPPESPELGAVRRSFELAAASGIEREYHTTLSPAFLDAETLEEMARALEPGGLWVLQQYEPEDILDAARAGAKRYDVPELEALAAVARRHHPRVLLRTGRGS